MFLTFLVVVGKIRDRQRASLVLLQHIVASLSCRSSLVPLRSCAAKQLRQELFVKECQSAGAHSSNMGAPTAMNITASHSSLKNGFLPIPEKMPRENQHSEKQNFMEPAPSGSDQGCCSISRLRNR